MTEPPTTERDLDQAVVDLAQLRGVRTYHTLNSRGSEPGFPDRVLWGPGGLAFFELKSTEGRPSRDQIRVLAELEAAPCMACRHPAARVGLWRPADLLEGRIDAILRQLGRRS